MKFGVRIPDIDVLQKENTEGKHGDRTGRTPLHKGLRIDPRRLMSKLLHVLNV